jgi:Flp pilus assembly protein CpaB
MKSKNMTLMVVAIGCGLVAAFLTARLSGGSGPEMVDVWVAKKEITVGTTLPSEEKELEGLIMQMKMAKDSLPPDIVVSKEDLKGKRVNRTLRQGNFFSPSDISADNGIKLPEGMRQVAIRTDVVKGAGGFVEAGKKVDIILVEALPNGKKKSGVILQNVLILAADNASRPAEGQGVGRAQLTSVSLAVTPKQSQVLLLAEARGELKLQLRDETSKDISDGDLTSEKIPGFDEEAKPTQTGPKTLPVIVVKARVPVNELITADNIDLYFTAREIPVEFISPKMIKDLDSIRGKYITKELEPDQFVFSTQFGASKVETGVAANPPVNPPTVENGMKENPTMPKDLAQEKSLYPRKFSQVINGKVVWWIQYSEERYEKVEGNAAELKDIPNTGGTTDKKEEKKPSTGDRAA